MRLVLLRTRFVVLLLVLVSSIGCDRVSKAVATTHLADGRVVELAGGTLLLGYAENRGAFLGLGASLPEALRWGLFVPGTALVLALFLLYVLKAKEMNPLELGGIALILGGGLGNLADRVAHGFVTDFAQIELGPLRTGVFNLADVAITIGAIALLAELVRGMIQTRGAEQP